MINIVRIEKHDNYLSIFVNHPIHSKLRWQSNDGHTVYPENCSKVLDLLKINFDINKYKKGKYQLVNDEAYNINISEENRFRNQQYIQQDEDVLIYLNLNTLEKFKFQMNKIFNFKDKKLKTGAKIRILYWLTKPFFIRKNIILFGERQDTMSDNSSYLFFNYFNKKYKSGYYLFINETAENVLKINTFKHILYFLNSKVCVNAYDIERYMTFQGYGKRGLLETFGDILSYKKVFLQHGVFYNDISNYIDKNKIHFDLVVVSTEHEKNFLIQHHYKCDEIVTSGLPRFNKLIDKSESIGAIDILIMPTWRSYITCEKEFLQSDYFKMYQHLLNQLIENHPDKRIVFFQHYEFKKYNKYFSNINVEIREDNDEIPELLMHAKVLITDYSSVLFDFNVMNKNVFLYQFDKDIFFDRHTKKPLIDFEQYSHFIKISNADEVSFSTVCKMNASASEHQLIKYKPDDEALYQLCDRIINLAKK
ncbi:hypothetical protein GTN30_04695 [Macrococcoides canis]|uniref:Uncharacterized protein n=1 Tax=Macrococcoides canis TaxID=1855823 RepID=A0AAE6X039_9STAP|nr:CDP-glycerol glycerophosphotransferase family protein [Macrococcus canis]QIH77961.1 hypothetical protein GTN30_04695 [Macrococcus canis]